MGMSTGPPRMRPSMEGGGHCSRARRGRRRPELAPTHPAEEEGLLPTLRAAPHAHGEGQWLIRENPAASVRFR